VCPSELTGPVKAHQVCVPDASGRVLSERQVRHEAQALQAVATASIAAPVTRRSGMQLTVLVCYACNQPLRNAFHYWAQNAIHWDLRSQQRYAALRARKHSHGRALLAVADRLQAVLIAMIRNNTLYDPVRHGLQCAAA
jgi:hypothetical protein